MPKRKRASSGRGRARKRVKKMSSTSLAKAVKKTVFKLAETKRLYANLAGTGGLVISNTVPISYNLVYSTFVRGLNDQQLIGDEYYLKGVRIRIGMQNHSTVTDTPYISNRKFRVHIAIIAAKAYASTTSLTWNDVKSDFLSNVDNEAPSFDPAKANVLRKVTLTVAPNCSATQGHSFYRSLYVPMNRKIKMKDVNPSGAGGYELKGWNYYVFLWCDSTSVVVGTHAFFNTLDATMYIKDM